MIIAVLVFGGEFVRSKKEQSCDHNDARFLKSFEFRNDRFENSMIALTECETYCSTDPDCWGCSRDCEKRCLWTAVTDCKEQRPAIDQSNITLSQKPGKHLEAMIF